ncbi:uncharacterized protein LOC142178234 [Nicotiana tabacum]|uniref:Uncharacterized protein LOC142178234 n=1 Tax=Nicotiana tabacum TaxID=4097 RepID=A0AC58U2H7_TOBAC
MAKIDNEVSEKLSHNHPLFLNSNDNSESILISLQLRGPENYSVWSRAMRIAILGQNKLGFIDTTCKRGNYGPNLVDLWERCNVIVLSWIMNCVSPELLNGIIYSSNVSAVWNDLKERLNLIVAPVPGRDCEKLREFVVFMEILKLLQFLMGLNESYEQARSQLLMMIPSPSVNKAYSIIMERESQREITHTSVPIENLDVTAFVSARGGFHQKPRKIFNIICDYCNYKGHTRENCFKLNGYLADFKHKKKGSTFPTTNFAGNTGGARTNTGLLMHTTGSQDLFFSS